MTWTLIAADCVEAMRGMEEASVDAVVTDPPYGLEFMGKEWDRLGGQGLEARPVERARFMQVWHEDWAVEALRVLKPGGHLLSFGGTRTYHRLVCALEDAGFEIRDCLAWLYGSGFPKSLDVSKAIDKAAGAAREVVGQRYVTNLPKDPERGVGEYVSGTGRYVAGFKDVTAPATADAERWQGWGTALKPAFEPIVLARKPLSGTVAENVLRHGTGALNVDGTRIGTDGETLSYSASEQQGVTPFSTGTVEQHPSGRWPANVLLDADAAAALDEQSGERSSGSRKAGDYRRLGGDGRYGEWDEGPMPAIEGSTGGVSRFFKVVSADGAMAADDSAAVPLVGDGGPGSERLERPQTPLRTFYTAKTSRAERENGVPQYMPDKESERVDDRHSDGRVWDIPGSHSQAKRNNHPTVKPVDLMQWLCRLITPPKGLILDPFTGSGSTGIAALREGFSFIGIERDESYVEIARARIIGDAPLWNVEAEV